VIDETRVLVANFTRDDHFVAEIHDRVEWAKQQRQDECFHNPKYGEYYERDEWFEIFDFIESRKMDPPWKKK
jgi:hypothetical protein